ncbi:hypothetical protein EDF41_3441 [Curtobacterium sp. PhB171]|nr:hypothetical protein EDF41_3441 [Curtobacterium sp. PhB171]ROQ28264.1 hypothetical protein EDF40_1395 [Curtobacterium sp. PhB170]ROS33204.1 hypothetical protein EDF25_3266 [Curtobacterium sp. PhB131]ROS72439.1 hypothetical protein EDF30_0368 [Curtobacterium sp. PhB141]
MERFRKLLAVVEEPEQLDIEVAANTDPAGSDRGPDREVEPLTSLATVGVHVLVKMLDDITRRL